MSDLSTPTVGLEVKEQQAQMEAGPQVDVSGAARGQPDWGALGEAGSNFGKTVTALFQDTAAKAEYLKYQQKLGDIERNYMFSNGNGSEEEIKKVQEETNKAWSAYKKATMNFNSKESMRLIDDANKYGVRYRDAILNTRAKFAEDYYQKNQNAVVGATAEDYVYALNAPGSKELQYAQNRLEYELNELLTHNGFSKDDPEYERVMRETKSAAVKSNIAFHVANRDWSKGWKNYTEYVKQGILVGQDRTDALGMLQILKDQLAAKSSSSSGKTDNLAYHLQIGALTAEEKDLVTGNNVPAALEADEQRYQAELANYNRAVSAQNLAMRQGGVRLGDGTIITAKGQRVPALPPKPQRKTRQQIYNEEYFKVEATNARNAQLYQEFGHVGAEVSSGLRRVRESVANDPDKLAEFSAFLMRATPEELITASGAFGADFASQVVADLKNTKGDKKFSELLDYWRHGVVRSEADYAAAKITAERMPMEDYQALQAQAVTSGRTIGEIIAAQFNLPVNVGDEVGLKLLKTYSDPDNSYASTRQREIIDASYDYLGKDFAKIAKIPEDQWQAFVKLPVVETAIKGMGVEAINSVINGEELTTFREALAQKNGGSPNDKQYINASYDKYQVNYELQEQFRDKFEELVEQFLERQQEELGLKPTRVTADKVSYGGQTYMLAKENMPWAQQERANSSFARFGSELMAGLGKVGHMGAQNERVLAESNQAFASAVGDAASFAVKANREVDAFESEWRRNSVENLKQGVISLDREVAKVLPDKLVYEPKQIPADLEEAMRRVDVAMTFINDYLDSVQLPQVPYSVAPAYLNRGTNIEEEVWNIEGQLASQSSNYPITVAPAYLNRGMAIEEEIWNIEGQMASQRSNYPITVAPGFMYTSLETEQLVWNKAFDAYNRVSDYMRYMLSARAISEGDQTYQQLKLISDTLSNTLTTINEWQIKHYKETYDYTEEDIQPHRAHITKDVDNERPTE